MKVVVTEAAWADLLTIGLFIKADNPARAELYVEELYNACLGIGEKPHAYPLLPEREVHAIRRRVFGRYLIFFRIRDDLVEIIYVLHGARNLDAILFDE